MKKALLLVATLVIFTCSFAQEGNMPSNKSDANTKLDAKGATQDIAKPGHLSSVTDVIKGSLGQVNTTNAQTTSEYEKNVQALLLQEMESNLKQHKDLQDADTMYRKFQYTHAQRAYTFQYWTSMAIFFVVIIIVLIGIVLSVMHFTTGLDRVRAIASSQTPPTAPTGGTSPSAEGASTLPSDASQTPSGESPTPSSIKLSLTSLEINTSLVGILVLTLSIAFFYLYLNTVYPINVKNSTPTSEVQSVNTASGK